MTVFAAFAFDDLTVGQEFVSSARTVTETDLVTFAMLSSDWNPVHTDTVTSSGTPSGQRIVHGVLGLALATGLFQRTGMFDGTAVALLSFDEWYFEAPILLGDTVHARMVIEDLRPTSRGDRGVVTRHIYLINQRGEVVQSGVTKLLVLTRDGAAAARAEGGTSR